MTVVLLLLLAVLLTEVFAAAAPAPALVTADGRSTSLSTRQLDQQKLTTAQRPVTMVTSAVTTSKGATTVKEQQKLTTVQRPVDHAVSAFTPKGSTTVKEQQVLSPVQPPVPGVVPAQRNMRAVLGQTITLPCRAPANVSIAAVKWSRPDLLPKYVLLFQNGQQVLGNQHLLFKNRVELKDKQMKKGELSLTLKSVKIGDAGTYECIYKEANGKTFSESFSTINLTVPLSDDATEDSTRHHSIMAITLSVIGLIAIFAIVTAVVVAIVRKCTRCCHRD
ncbi:uncharacterized protein [Channa argus]|uniref:uncharacterized protein isoform X3 n=1 Tax=Channa argus TaxID=215402 RepID=UPI00352177E8